METTSVPLRIDHPGHREPLVRRAKRLAWLGVGWHAIEAAVAVGAGIVAGSVALVGFGADSLVESFAGFALLWRFGASRASSERAERRAQRLIGASFFVIAAYVAIEAIGTLLGGSHPDVSYVGIGLAAVALITMPPLAAAKAHVGEKLGSSATKSEGRQNLLCAYLSAALLAGLGANAILGWWWADPVTALLIAAVAMNEGREAWAGGDCDDCCHGPVERRLASEK
jgi:divalent metal cation (Fe/Co/Zn/Cd) transporter